MGLSSVDATQHAILCAHIKLQHLTFEHLQHRQRSYSVASHEVILVVQSSKLLDQTVIPYVQQSHTTHSSAGKASLGNPKSHRRPAGCSQAKQSLQQSDQHRGLNTKSCAANLQLRGIGREFSKLSDSPPTVLDLNWYDRGYKDLNVRKILCICRLRERHIVIWLAGIGYFAASCTIRLL